jgi:hypothetical protein
MTKTVVPSLQGWLEGSEDKFEGLQRKGVQPIVAPTSKKRFPRGSVLNNKIVRMVLKKS